MVILGIHDGHNSGCSIFVNGINKCTLSEEKITRKKNEYGFPEFSIREALKFCKLKKNQIDFVAVSTKFLPPKYFFVKRNTTFKIDDYLKEQNEYWYPRLYKNKKVKYLDIFKNKILKKNLYSKKFIKNEDDVMGMQEARKDLISEFLNISKKKVNFYDHHKCHAYYGYFGSSFNQKKKVAIVTADGGGDNCNASIWIAKNGEIKNIYKTNIGNIGRIYRYFTLLLGMKPTEHEFKVMGMAGYGSTNTDYYKTPLKILTDTLNIKNTKFYYKKNIKDHFFYFKNKLGHFRFDTLSFVVQKFTEDLLSKWFLNISKKYNVNDFVFSGGVAQNIKATKKILELKSVNSLFIPPGPGDESLSIGACYIMLHNLKVKKKNIQNISNPYLGKKFEKNELDFIFEDKKLKVEKTNSKKLAKILSSGNVIARYSSDNFEFGPRALGNRSIIADPRNQDTINVINKKIKVRDFWMPFAPSILEEDMDKYIINPKKQKPYFMTMGFDTTSLGKKKLNAACHPFDKTARPQLVSKRYNSKYYDLIKEFKKITGLGAILNTSFNLHGEPIVYSPKDAIRTFKNSGLEYLNIDNLLIRKI
jgi:carbamoyltransferase